MVAIQFLLLATFWSICGGAKILAVMPIPSFSHQVVFMPLWEKLLARGHELTLLTTEPMTGTNLSNLRQIDLSFAKYLFHVKHNYSNIIKKFRENKLECFNQYANMMQDIVVQELEHVEVQRLIGNESEHFDLAIIEYLHPTMLAFSERFNCPYIGVSSMDIISVAHDMVGNPTNPAIYTDFLAPYESKMSFYERILNTVSYIGTSVYFNLYVFPKEDVTVSKYFGKDLPKLKDIQKKVSMVFLNTHPILHGVRPLVPNVLQIGGAIHIHKLNALPKELETFLDRAHNGAIYFSLGSNVQLSDLAEETLNMLLEVFKSLPYAVVWKSDIRRLGESTKNLSNIYVSNWLPQQEVLAHRHVKLFITQGGQQSLEEAIYYGVPLIGMPFYVDQFANIRRLTKRGACKTLDPQNLKKADLQNAITEVLTNKTYSNSIKELSALLKERAISSVDEAVWWAEYVIRHKGAKILKSEAPNLPLYQYLLLDVIGLLVLVVALGLTTQYMLMKCLIRYIRYKVRHRKFVKLE